MREKERKGKYEHKGTISSLKNETDENMDNILMISYELIKVKEKVKIFY
jgi:hypothetical protein